MAGMTAAQEASLLPPRSIAYTDHHADHGHPAPLSQPERAGLRCDGAGSAGAPSRDASLHALVQLVVPEQVGARDEAEQPSLVVEHVQPAGRLLDEQLLELGEGRVG